MLDRNECKKMFVWDNDNNKERKRIVIYINNDGSCVAVAHADEAAFLRGDDFRTVSWDNCEPIPEKKFRPMTNEEMRGFIANTLGIEIRHKSWELSGWMVHTPIGVFKNSEDWQYRAISPTGETGESQDFVMEVEKC